MNISDKLFEYLQEKLPGFAKTKQSGSYMFTCPNISNHKYAKEPSATVINGTDKLNCLRCGWKGTFYDCVRLIEPDKAKLSDGQITEYLINSLHVDMYKELEVFKSYGWALVPIAKNSKRPIENDWTNITHYEKADWMKWLNNGFNLGVRTGEVSKITVIDVDNKGEVPDREAILQELKDIGTLEQNTANGGKHYIFKYDAEIPQVVDMGGLKIDTRNEGGQILIQPSHLDAKNYIFVNLGTTIKEIPVELKTKLLELCGSISKPKAIEVNVPSVSLETSEGVAQVKEGEGRNNLLLQLGGALINKADEPTVAYTLQLINKTFFKPELPQFEIQAMIKSLTKYKSSNENTEEQAIYEYMKLMQTDISAKDIMDSLKFTRAIADKYLSKFVKDGKAIRLARGRYKYREKVEWADKFVKLGNYIDYKLPYFNSIANFASGDILLLGGKTSNGKTTVALNIIKQIVAQGIKPFYIYSESGSRCGEISETLGLAEGCFYHSFHANPLSIEIEPNSFTVLDWLLISEKENTDTVFKFFAEEMQRKGGILIIMMQLKDNYDYFAPNLVCQFPSVAARYLFDDETGKYGHWQVDKIRDPKGNYRNYLIPCEYDFEKKTLTAKDGLGNG
jgi:hypothetical protein